MSDDDHNSHRGYGRDDGNYGGDQSRGYGGRGGEADEYYNESGERPAQSHSGRQVYDDGDDRRGEYGAQQGRRYEGEESGGGYSGSAGGRRYDDSMGVGYGSHDNGGRRYNDDNSGGGYGGSAGGNGGCAGYGNASGHGGGSSGYDQDEVINQARRHGSDDDGNLFSQALSFLGQKKDDDEDLDEQRMIGAHQQLYGDQSGTRPHDANTLGAAAAMQALKMFTGGGAGAGGMGSQGAGNSQSQLIGIAMAQAARVFDQQSGQGNLASGADKQSAINTAAKLALQMYSKSEGQGGGGGPGGLMGMASKFLSR